MSGHTFHIPEQPRPPEYVFGLATPADMLRKLAWEIRRFKDQLKVAPQELFGMVDLTYCAFNTAVTAFHCGDWAWRSLDENGKRAVAEKFTFQLKGSDETNLKAFMNAVCSDRRSLEICRLIANGSKHMGTHGKPTSPFVATTVWNFEADESKNCYLAIEDGGVIQRAEQIFDDAFDYWERFFGDFGFIEGKYIGPELDR